jgi:peptide/nickel transport system permease protein
LWPALFISMTVLGISLLGDGLRERLDPSLRTQL